MRTNARTNEWVIGNVTKKAEGKRTSKRESYHILGITMRKCASLEKELIHIGNFTWTT